MEHDIAIGVADQAALVRDGNAAERHIVAGPEGVNVVAGADPDVAERPAPLPRRGCRSAATKSSADVSFMLPASPATTLTAIPAHSATRGVIGEVAADPFAAFSWAARMAAKRKP